MTNFFSPFVNIRLISLLIIQNRSIFDGIRVTCQRGKWSKLSRSVQHGHLRMSQRHMMRQVDNIFVIVLHVFFKYSGR